MINENNYWDKYNWDDIQKYYNDGHNWKEVLKEFNISSHGLDIGVKQGRFKTKGRSESARIRAKNKPLKHSEETKKKLSEIRKKYLAENPDKVPYKLNHSSKESYPEKYFTEVFKNEEIDVVKSFYIGLYELDFCIPDKKIDIEIDGSQHYYDKKIVESDKRRNEFLENDGWDIIRINWSHYQKLDLESKKEYILNLKSYINGLISSKPTILFIDNSVCICGNKKQKSSKICRSCSDKNNRKVERPSLEQLKIDIEGLGYTGTGRKYGMSSTSIRRWSTEDLN
jgi:very-short-patch-repair endonuclease